MTVRLHTGDPSIYGAVKEQMDLLDEAGIGYESCPGVTACFGAAAAMNLEFTLPGISLSLIITRLEGRTRVPDGERLESLASHGASMAVYLSAGMMDEVGRRLMAGGYGADTPAALVYRATWPEEQIHVCTVGTLGNVAREQGIRKTAVVLVGDVIRVRQVAAVCAGFFYGVSERALRRGWRGAFGESQCYQFYGEGTESFGGYP